LLDDDGLTLLAQYFDSGGQGVAYNDDAGRANSGSFPQSIRTDTDVELAPNGAIGWTRVGEWIEYTIDVEQAGTYAFNLETATPNAGRNVTASFEKDGTVYETTGTIATPVTGSYGVFTATPAVEVELEAGVQVLRITFGRGNDQDLRSLSLIPVAIGTTQRASGQPVEPVSSEHLPLLADGGADLPGSELAGALSTASEEGDFIPSPVAGFELLSLQQDALDHFTFDRAELWQATNDPPDETGGLAIESLEPFAWSVPIAADDAVLFDYRAEDLFDFSGGFAAGVLGHERHIDVML
jgi:hypothetical protein